MTAQVLVDGIPATIERPDDTKKHPGLLLIHEVWGLTKRIKSLAKRFAQEGYIVMAPDLYGDGEIINKIDKKTLLALADPTQGGNSLESMRAALWPLRNSEHARVMTSKLNKCFTYLQSIKKVNRNIGVIGFCVGGSYCLNLAAKQSKIKAIIPFYGFSPDPISDIKNICCPILAFCGKEDRPVIESMSELEKMADIYHIDFETVIFPDTGHAFFDESNQAAYNEEAAKRAWIKSITFLRKHLG